MDKVGEKERATFGAYGGKDDGIRSEIDTEQRDLVDEQRLMRGIRS